MAYFVDYSRVVVTAGRLNFTTGQSETILVTGKPRLPGLGVRGEAQSTITINGRPRLPKLITRIEAEEVISKNILSAVFDNKVSVTIGRFNLTIIPRAKFVYPKFGTNFELFVPQKVHESNFYYPIYGFGASGGQFPPEYTDVLMRPITTIQASLQPDFTVVEPDPFLFAEWTYPAFSASGSLVQNNKAEADTVYPIFGFSALGGTIEVEGEAIYPKYSANFRLVNTREVEAALQYPFFEADFNVDARYKVNSENIYPSYSMNGEVLYGYKVDADNVYPTFGIVGDIEQAHYETATIDFIYPLFESSSIIVKDGEVLANIQYPVFHTDAEFYVPHHAYGDQVYPVFTTDGFVGPLGAMQIEVVYPTFSASGEGVPFIPAEGAYEYPSYSVAIELTTLKIANVNIQYPVFGVSGEVKAPIGSFGDFKYHAFSAFADIHAPLGVLGDTQLYPQFSIAGFAGAVVKVKDTDFIYPLLTTEGQIAYTASADVILRYPLYQFAGLSANVPVGEGEIVYPIFGTAFTAESYYGADMDVEVINLDEDFDADSNLPARKQVFVIER